MTKLHFNEKIRVHDIDQCDKQDLQDISSLMAAIVSLMVTAKREKRTAITASVLFHSLAILNGIIVIRQSMRHEQDKAILLMYIPLIIYIAKLGFDSEKKYQAAKAEYNELAENYTAVKQVIETVPCDQIHKIAEIYKDAIPNNNDINSDDIKKAIRYILIRYQR